jgi:hypothetical protein
MFKQLTLPGTESQSVLPEIDRCFYLVVAMERNRRLYYWLGIFQQHNVEFLIDTKCSCQSSHCVFGYLFRELRSCIHRNLYLYKTFFESREMRLRINVNKSGFIVKTYAIVVLNRSYSFVGKPDCSSAYEVFFIDLDLAVEFGHNQSKECSHYLCAIGVNQGYCEKLALRNNGPPRFKF